MNGFFQNGGHKTTFYLFIGLKVAYIGNEDINILLNKIVYKMLKTVNTWQF